ncbi:hypothetical protein EC990672_2000 [Escherichia coli 99.0672]|nr:hypothetical protein ECOK1180_3208 [Escherichia coli OK1180]EHU94075.1 hypothetical protein ECDEC4A_1962 [Escherichia coli DEC4A]EHW19438.1 hypothetical protein ECDEC8C_2160 [Escherichia coli DEC8C]EIN26128.1 hypothetical protein ECFRIK1996_1991 [Escherichia coli FRIK1996]EIN42762.1 hypothetical protein EC93001_2135 [Escherichia coli 93-001]EIN78032.1 hypothetical protein ECPA10_2051 [Escherichia coli PA10]EIO41996.1 hypothetical protein ECPA39_1996 [Escherichia coli PA39]EIO65863.1 hypot
MATIEKVRHFMESVSPFPEGKHGLAKMCDIRRSYLVIPSFLPPV